jgi:glycosyltransferase involved in cell wall biosynthesis
MNIQINKNNTKNLVSVIICFLNAEKFIQEAIESVLAQTYSNWELLLIDDGSTDGSSEIARQYAERYPEKVRYVEHEEHKNRGSSVSRNIGINKSNGEYIAFLDVDDVWLPQKLKEQIQIMNLHPEVAMVCGPNLYWYSWTGKPKDAKRDYLEKLPVEMDAIIKPPRLLRKQVQMADPVPAMSSLLIRREVVNRIGGFEESIPNLLDDQVLFVKIFADEPVFVASQIWCKYRQHPDSICKTIGIQKHRLLSERFWKWVKQYLTNKGVKEEEIWSIVDERIRNRRYGPQ